MDMDLAWKQVYERKSRMQIPDHEKSCWSKEGFEELLEITHVIIDSIPDLKTILDVGCGPGIYCDTLHKKGYEIHGIDYSESTVAIAKENYPHINFQTGSGYALEFDDKSFDAIISIGALQCLEHHEVFLKELCRVAKKAIIISTHLREKEIQNPRAALKRQLAQDTWPVREYNVNEIIPLLEENGFEAEIMRTYNGKIIKEGSFIIAKKKAF